MKTNIKKALEMREDIQAKHGHECVTLFRTADEYELYSDDAITNYFAVGAKMDNEDDVTFCFATYIEDGRTIMVAKAIIVYDKLDQVLPKIIRKGKRVCIVDAPVEYTTTNAR